jgi:lipopolysaccharide biosynthesis protein
VAPLRVVAFYLPQFHPIPENDRWWGNGFTEWTSTVRARPLFRGHSVPHLPADLGFYDLRVPDARRAQADLAAAYGVSAFCYWHYWFAGRRLLERPFEEVLASGEPSLPFCLGWANQTWSGAWHGAPNRTLCEQTYPGPVDDAAHFEYLTQAFHDYRYFTVDGRPLFYVYRPEQLPDAAVWVERWRALADRAGLPGIYLVAEVSDLLGHGPKYDRIEADGWDAGVDMRLPASQTLVTTFAMRLRRKVRGGPEVYPYLQEPLPARHGLLESLLPAVHPNWDNTPRAGRGGLVLHGATPDAFRRHVEEAARRVANRPLQERLIFVKSWNEWAESNYLEPDLEYGHGWLAALREGLVPDRAGRYSSGAASRQIRSSQ